LRGVAVGQRESFIGVGSKTDIDIPKQAFFQSVQKIVVGRSAPSTGLIAGTHQLYFKTW
jgi:hypothetical protein